jgi:D-glycero-alpha-D-manno-heptose 1-phosphate guanylyltransferase
MGRSLANVTGAILAGGMGTRLRACVADRPKVLAPVRGRPYLTYLLDQLAAAGLREVVLLTGYLGDMVRTVLGETYAGILLAYSREPSPLGTAGAVRLALPCVASSAVMLLNGDSFCDVDLPKLWDFHCRQQAEVTMTLSSVADTARYGRVRIARDTVECFEEKQATSGAGWINAGVYLLNRDRIVEIPSGRPVSLERDMLPVWAGRGCVRGFRCTGRFLDIGTPESYAEAETFFRAA